MAFGAASSAAPSFSFGAPAAPPAPPNPFAKARAGAGSGSWQAALELTCALPEQVLQYSDRLRMSSAVEAHHWSMNDFGRILQLAVTAARSAKATAAQQGGRPAAGAGASAGAEDPLVAAVLGQQAAPPPMAAGTGAGSMAALLAQREAALVRWMALMLSSWWMLMLDLRTGGANARPPVPLSTTAEHAGTAATQHAQLKAQLPQLTELSQLMAGITACCANLPVENLLLQTC